MGGGMTLIARGSARRCMDDSLRSPFGPASGCSTRCAR